MCEEGLEPSVCGVCQSRMCKLDLYMDLLKRCRLCTANFSLKPCIPTEANPAATGEPQVENYARMYPPVLAMTQITNILLETSLSASSYC